MIEIKGFVETSFLDWPGKICSILFLPGCNFPLAGQRKQRLLQVARAADADELRSQARLAVETWDIKAALHLSEMPEVYQLPASTLRQLAMLIYFGDEGSHRKSAVQLVENALFHRPGDFQLNMACANYYSRLVPPQWAEAARYNSIAIALRPDDARTGMPGPSLC